MAITVQLSIVDAKIPFCFVSLDKADPPCITLPGALWYC